MVEDNTKVHTLLLAFDKMNKNIPHRNVPTHRSPFFIGRDVGSAMRRFFTSIGSNVVSSPAQKLAACVKSPTLVGGF